MSPFMCDSFNLVLGTSPGSWLRGPHIQIDSVKTDFCRDQTIPHRVTCVDTPGHAGGGGKVLK